jgi:hypothetical protein
MDAMVEIDREAVRRALAALEVPLEAGVILRIWPMAEGRVEVHLSPATFWRVVKRCGLLVASTEEPELLFPYRHRFSHSGVEFITFTREPVLPPGVLTPGFALRLT